MKRILFLLFVTISLNCVAQIVGDGTSENPYLISSAEELCYMRDKVNSGDENYSRAYYKQTNDIILNEYLDGDNLNEWVPIGNSENPFQGVYDGSCFQVKGVYINNDLNNQGFFGVNEGVVRYLGLSDSYISANKNVGGIVGYNYGEISFCYNESHINGVMDIGGICGTNRMRVDFCYNLGDIECSFDYVGGITAVNIINTNENVENSGIVSNCYNAGKISGGDSAAGVSVVENLSTLFNCYNVGSVANGYPVALQYNNSNELFYDNQVVVSANIDKRAKGLATAEFVGNNLFAVEGWEYNEWLYPQISCIKTDKSLLYATPIFLSNGETINNIFSDFKVSIENGVAWSCKNGLVEIDVEGNVKIISYGDDVLIAQLGEYIREIPITTVYEPNINGVGTHTNPYKISNAEELLEVARLINSGEPLYDKLCYKVAGSVVLNKDLLDRIENNDTVGLVEWIPIKNFSGVFEFDLFAGPIKGMYLNDRSDNQGMFIQNNGEIKGLYLRDSYIKGNKNVCGVCCENNGVIKTCIIQNSVISGQSASGICCQNNGEITQVWNQSDILGETHVAGISMYNYGRITNCRNDGDIEGYYYLAGISCGSFGNIKHCINSGNIVCGDGEYIGGIAVSTALGEISHCVNSGFLKGKDEIGGIAVFENFSQIVHCYNIGHIVCTNGSRVAAITPQYMPPTDSNYYDIQTSGVGDEYAQGLTTAEMTSGNLFNDSDNWYEEKGLYPQFSSAYLSVPDIYPIFLSDNETVNNVNCDFTVHPSATYTSKNNRVQFDEEGNARISSVGEDTIIVNNSRILPIRITVNPNEIVKPSRYYTLCDGNNKYLSAGKTLTMADCQDNSTIFYLDEGNGLLSYNNGLYINKNIGFDEIGQKGVAVNFANGTVDNTVLVGLSNGCHLGSNGSDVSMSETEWLVEEAIILPVTITSAGYASFYAPVEVTLPDGVTAYYITSDGVNDGYVSLTMIENGIVPAKTGVILASENPGTYNLFISNTGTNVVKRNLLKGTVAATNISEDAYVLYNNNGNVGLYLAEMNQNNATAFKNNSHKAYLPVNALPASMQESTGFRFDISGLTAVEELELENRETKNVYDLMGRRINSPAKGIYIINGKKVIVK